MDKRVAIEEPPPAPSPSIGGTHGEAHLYDLRTRLDQDLKAAVSRLRQLRGATAIEEWRGTIGNTCPFADEVDGIQASESREIGFATRKLVLERANRLSAALDRINEGEYGHLRGVS